MISFSEKKSLSFSLPIVDSLLDLSISVRQTTLQKKMTLLPLRLETLGQKQRKRDLEQKLQEIENAISVFDQKKVFVTNEMIQKYNDKADPISSNQDGAKVDTIQNRKSDTRNKTEALARAHNGRVSQRNHIAGAAA